MAENSPTPHPSERLDDSASEASWRGHIFRYRLAAGFCEPTDIVLDAACGSGYGTEILLDRCADVVGVDRDISATEGRRGEFLCADLEWWLPEFAFDIFVGFETIEHLPDFSTYVDVAKQARRLILLSAPIIPTVGVNPWHVHNFAPGELAGLICDGEWRLWQSILQPSEVSEVYVFARR